MEEDETKNVSNQNAQNATEQNNVNQNQDSTSIDYEKIQKMIDGRNAKTEDSILKSYFEKQGLSADEMESAIIAFKDDKSKKADTKNKKLSDMETEFKKLQLENKKLKVEQKAYDFIDELNVDNKTMPYILKVANLENCIDEKGNINEDNLKEALTKVITDIPGFKKQVQENVGIKVGADTNNSSNSNNDIFDFNFTGVRPKK